MAISCVYCGGAHDTAGEVRSCWERQGASQLTLDAPGDAPGDPPVGPSAPVTAVTPRAGRTPQPRARAMAALGRNAVVAPGDGEPEGWHGARRVTVTERDVADPRALTELLDDAAARREPLVLELSAAAAQALTVAEVEHRPTHQLGARFNFAAERLAAQVWRNSVDSRGDEARFALLDAAMALGARPASDGRGDVELRAGGRAWLDGGPVRRGGPIDGIPILHRIAVEHGSLEPFAVAGEALADLAPDQLAAVRHDGGSARIIAPAGSGKTRVLTERARHLLRAWRLPPSAVCLVAFNKRAQEEMRARTTDLRGLQVRTLNAIALAIVNGSAPFAAQREQRRTIDEPEVRRLIGKLVNFPRRRNADPIATWIEALSLARLGLRSPSDVEAAYGGEVDGFVDVLPRYRSELRRNQVLDFDEQVQVAIEILLTDPQARATAQRACRLLLVDEFQDLTPAHVLLIRLLAGPDLAVFGVGDDDQTIYGYNGADPAFLIDFAALFPGAGDHPLEVNYRCPAGIVESVERLLRYNRRRVPKVIRAADEAEHGWSLVAADDPVAATVGAVRTALDAGRPTTEIAVLTRVNSLLAPVQVALAVAGIDVAGGVGAEFLERTAVRSALAWLRLATAGDDDRFSSTDIAEALRRPSRPLHPNVATWVAEQSSLAGLRRLVGRLNNGRDADRVAGFADDIQRLQDLVRARGTTADVLDTLRDSLGLAGSIASLDTQRVGMNRAAQHDDLVAISQLAALHPDPAGFESWLRNALVRRRDDRGVTLATVHRVKGQEWPVVVVHLAESDQFPHRLADDVEEERRLFHVALTRAAHEATIVVDDTPSPFILQLVEEPPARLEAEPAPRRVSAPAPASRSSRPGHDLTGADAALFAALRDLRRHLAAGKPAYTVLADSSLQDIATRRPTSLAQLATIHGIGPTKLDRYGAALLAVVEDHL